jgi:hypothetical protein
LAAQKPASTDIIWNQNDQHTFADPSNKLGNGPWSPPGANLESQYPAFDVLSPGKVAIPEPSTLSLLVAPLLLFGAVLQRRTAASRA